MTAVPVLLNHQSAARTRAGLDTAALGLPAVLVVAALGWRLFGTTGAVIAAVVGLARPRRSCRLALTPRSTCAG